MKGKVEGKKIMMTRWRDEYEHGVEDEHGD
jgi:hypothetical protein